MSYLQRTYDEFEEAQKAPNGIEIDYMIVLQKFSFFIGALFQVDENEIKELLFKEIKKEFFFHPPIRLIIIKLYTTKYPEDKDFLEFAIADTMCFYDKESKPVLELQALLKKLE
jgi:hypothetical protein